jgi:inositol hexakisphosphate/diphosphoinositol-pentakisphosphate kinase
MILFHFPPLNSFQARLNEIITLGAKTVQNNGSSEVPWMVDGAGLPSNASELLPKLVMTLPKRSNA